MDETNDEQARLWNGPAGMAWVDGQGLLDQAFRPFEELLAGAIPRGARVLDVGCGTGATTLALVRDKAARAVGIDLSEPMVACARERARKEGSKAVFVRADAETHAFDAGAFDAVVSRFGVMFFSDPVRAFTNLRRAATAGASLCCLAFRAAADNPFMTAAERAAAPLLPALPARRPGAPGQFAFADEACVRAVLERSGWRDVEVRAVDVACSFPATELDYYLTRLGPVGLVLQGADEGTRARVMAVVRPAFEPYLRGGEVRFDAACWRIGARNATS